MKNFITNNWFKLIISVAIIIAAASVSYYYTSYLPRVQKQNSQLANSNNNPGLIQNDSGKIITFNSAQDGFAALLNQIQAILDGKSPIGLSPNSTLCDYSKAYSKISGNEWVQYCADLANLLGVNPDTTIGSLQPRIGDLASAIAINNGFRNIPLKGKSN